MFFIKKVLILFGGNSSEHYISCISCVSVLKNIDRKKYDIEVAGISKNNIWYKYFNLYLILSYLFVRILLAF